MGDVENPGDVIGLTLWGDPVYRVPRKRGRPRFEWTEENSRKISMMLAAGWCNEKIAGCVLDPRTGERISVPTLKRYFRAELRDREFARDRMKVWQLMTAAQEAAKGNVGAMRLFQVLIEKNDQMEANSRVAKRVQAPAAAADRPGKKALDRSRAQDAEQALLAALSAEVGDLVRQ